MLLLMLLWRHCLHCHLLRMVTVTVTMMMEEDLHGIEKRMRMRGSGDEEKKWNGCSSEASIRGATTVVV